MGGLWRRTFADYRLMTKCAMKLREMRTTVSSVNDYIRPRGPELVAYDIAVHKIYCSADSYLRFLLFLAFRSLNLGTHYRWS